MTVIVPCGFLPPSSPNIDTLLVDGGMGCLPPPWRPASGGSVACTLKCCYTQSLRKVDALMLDLYHSGACVTPTLEFCGPQGVLHGDE